MAVTSNVSVNFTKCPRCKEDFEILVEILHHTKDNIDGTLGSWGFNYKRNGSRIIEIVFSCGGLCSFKWQQGLADIIGWNC